MHLGMAYASKSAVQHNVLLDLNYGLFSFIIWLEPTGVMSDVNARLVKREYRKCKSTLNSNSSNDLKLNEKRQFL